VTSRRMIDCCFGPRFSPISLLCVCVCACAHARLGSNINHIILIKNVKIPAARSFGGIVSTLEQLIQTRKYDTCSLFSCV
jgi:hypothetical protein